MRLLTVVFVAVPGFVVSYSRDSAEPEFTEAEVVWCADLIEVTSRDAIRDAANQLAVDTIGRLMLARTGITTDLHPNDLGADDRTEEEAGALIVVDADFENGGDV